MEGDSNNISLQEATKYCGYSQEYLSLRARHGKLKAIKFGRNWVTKKEWLDEYLKKTEKYNNNSKLNHVKKFVLPPQNLPIEKIPVLRFSFVTALVFVLLTAGITFGKESFKNVFNDASPLVQGFNQEFDRGMENFVYTAGTAGDIIVEEIGKSIGGSFKNVGYQSTDIGNVFKDYGFWLFQQAGEIARGYNAVNNVVEEKLRQINQIPTSFSENFDRGMILGMQNAKFKMQNFAESISDSASLVSAAGDIIIEKAVKSTVDIIFSANQSFVNVGYPIRNAISNRASQFANIGGAMKDIPQQVSKSYFSANDVVEQKLKETGNSLAQGYKNANEFVKKGIVLGIQNLKEGYLSTNEFVEKKLAQGYQLVTQPFIKAYHPIRDSMAGFVKDVSSGISNGVKFITSPRRITLPEKIAIEEGIKKEKLESFQEEVEKLKEEDIVSKEVIKEVSKIIEVQPVKEITREFFTLDVESLRKLQSQVETQTSQITNLQVEMNRRPTGFISSPNLIQPVSQQSYSPKLYVENGQVTLETAGSGNIVFLAANDIIATGRNFYIGANLIVSGTQTFNSNSSSTALTVVQNGTGNIVEFKDGGTSVFTIADGGYATFATYASTTPAVLIRSPDTLWASASSTYFAIAGTSTFTGRFIDIQKDGASLFYIDGSGNIVSNGTLQVATMTAATTTFTGDLTVSGNILPATTTTYNIGSAIAKWGNIYAATATIGNTIVINTNTISATSSLNLTGAAASTWQTSGTNSTLTIQSASSTLISSANTLTASSTSDIILTTAATERMRILSTGNVVIGSSTAVALFSVATSTNIFNVTSGGNVGIGTTTPAYTLDTFGTFRAVSTSTFGGNVGIGTTTPTAKLHIYVGATTYTTMSGGAFDLYSQNSSTPVFRVTGGSNADLVNFVDSSNIVFVIKDGGNVGIGTTTPAALLDVWASSTASALTITQAMTGNIIDFKFATTSVFTLASADRLKLRKGLLTTYGDINDIIIDDFERIFNWISSAPSYTVPTTTTAVVKVNDYALKITTSVGNSNNTTATTSTSTWPTANWSAYDRLGFWIRAGYTTTSTAATTTQIISIMFYDTNGTTSSSTVSIQRMNEWQYQEWDISGIAVGSRNSVDWVGFRIDNDYGSPTFYIDQIRLYAANLQAGEMFVDSEGNFVIWGQKSVEIGRTSANQGSLPSIKAGTAIVELNQPLAVNVGGDVGITYNLAFTNTGLSQITSEGPLAILAGDPNHTENLTIGTQGTGDVIVDIVDSTTTYGGFKILGSDSGGYIFRISPTGSVEIGGSGSGASNLTLKQNLTLTGGNITISRLATTTAPTLSTTTSGYCAAATYSYRIAASNDNGTTTGSATATKAVALNEAVVVSWTGVTGAVKHSIWRSIDETWGNANDYQIVISAPTTVYTDTCTTTQATSTFPTSNTTGGGLTISGNIVPSASSTYSLGSASSKWANIYAATTTVGDLVFGNFFRITEAMSTSTPEKLIFQNASSTPIMAIDENGNLTVTKLTAKEIETERITIKDSEVSKTGITIYDRSSGEPYCIYIEAGVMQTAVGECKNVAVGQSTTTQIYYYDGDGDSYGTPANFVTGATQDGYVPNSDDCDDSNSAVHPAATEICDDGIDNNCDGKIDSNDASCNVQPEELPVEPPAEPVCTPNWSCSDWGENPSLVLCGNSFTQTCICTDSNNCGVEEGKPAETQSVSGVKCEASNAMGVCQSGACNFICAEGFSNCDNNMQNGCEIQLETSTSTCPTL